MRLLLVLLLSACASSPSEYRRGTFAPPPPAQARPGVGLPTYDPHARPLPPQPNPRPKRVLPETPASRRGPGIWAGDEPTGHVVPTFLDVPLPVADAELDHPAVKGCYSGIALAVLNSQDLTTAALRHSRPERACVAYAVFAECLRVAVRDGPGDVVLKQAWERADKAVDDACKGGVFATAKDLAYALENALRRPQTPPGGLQQ